MPEQPERKCRPIDVAPVRRPQRIRYAELHLKTNFSFLEGASHPDELVHRATELGYTAIAVTDRNSLAGVVRAHIVAKEIELKLLVGAEITPLDAPPVVLLAADRAAYGRLVRLITLGRRNAPKGECQIRFDDLAAHAAGLIAAVGGEIGACEPSAKILPLPLREGRGEGEMREKCSPHPALSQRERVRRTAFAADSLDDHDHLHRYRELFGDRCYLLAELHCGPNDERQLEQRIALSKQTGVPLVAANDVHFHHPSRRALADVLTATRHGCTVAAAGELLFPNAARHLKSPQEMLTLFARAPEAIARTVEIADRCTFSLDELRYEYPEELAPPGQTPMEYLTRLAWEGAGRRYSQGVPSKVGDLITHELKLIRELHYEAYFLTVWDLMQFARSRNILCQGRGSAANSAVCYCLEITAVDPLKLGNVVFERFISRERDEAPDIDVDFEHERREEVIQYVYDKYGRDRAGMTAEVITYRPRSAVRDVGKALGFSLDQVDALAKALDAHRELPMERCTMAGIDPNSTIGRQLLGLVGELLGFPRHLGQHVGGLVITQGPLCELVPIENASMEGRTVIEWDKDDLDELGILKVDCLSLGMLTAIHKCLDLVNGSQVDMSQVTRHQTPATSHPLPLTLDTVPHDDPSVYEMICRADTMGVFQIESRAQMSMLPRLRPRKFYDLVIEVAIVRPGPIQGDMVHPYLRRRTGQEQVDYPNEEIHSVLHSTLGVPLFQEQAMRLAVVAAGFTPGEADQLRRAMAAWRRPGLIDTFHTKLVDGMITKGYDRDFAERLFNQIRGFGEYGFPESHAASFALLAYVSAWLKYHYPAEFCMALLNSQPMGFYAPAQLVRNAQEHGVEVRPVDVNFSQWDSTIEAVDTEALDKGPFTLKGLHSIAQGRSPWGAHPGLMSPHVSDNPEGVALPGSAKRVESFQGSRRGNNPHPPRVAAAATLGFGMERLQRSADSESHSTSTSPDDRSANARVIRLGLRMIIGLSRAQALQIEEARRAGPFQSLDDFATRTGVSPSVVTRLAQADAFGSCGLDRRSSLWQTLAQERRAGDQPLFKNLDHDEPSVLLPAMGGRQEVFADYQTVGLSLKAHPISFYREEMNRLGIVPASQLANLKNGRYVRVGGLVLVRQRPGTAKGITFVTIEDETGTANLIVRMDVWERFYQVARTASAYIAYGRLQKEQEVIHVLVTKLENLAETLQGLRMQSRDFQ
jgi:error-prone DNA polymerase